jgi:hypothetical protein
MLHKHALLLKYKNDSVVRNDLDDNTIRIFWRVNYRFTGVKNRIFPIFLLRGVQSGEFEYDAIVEDEHG